MQYKILGLDEFMERYVRGWAENGSDYFRIPLEVMAYELQEQYEVRKDSFPVEKEVARLLGQQGRC